MAINKKVLELLNGWQPFTNDNRRLEITEDTRRVSCEIVALDSLACAFMHVTVHVDALAGASIDKLKRVGEELANKLTYLLEPIHPVEVDAEQCIVQLRSVPPDRDDDGTSYYELLVRRDGDLNLCRYAKQPGDQRRQVPAHVTREVIARLMSDFGAVEV